MGHKAGLPEDPELEVDTTAQRSENEEEEEEEEDGEDEDEDEEERSTRNGKGKDPEVQQDPYKIKALFDPEFSYYALRGVAMRIFESIRDILGENTTVTSLDKIVEEYGPPDFSDDEDQESEDGSEDETIEDGDGEGVHTKKRKRSSGKRRHKPPPRPDDWQYDFRQNCDDDFKMGIQFNPGRGKGNGSNKGVYLRLFSDFFISDVIVASPLGLRLIIEKFQSSIESDEYDDKSLCARKTKKKNQAAAMKSADFLSSLEIIVMHQVDVLFMQNWDHVEFILQLTTAYHEVIDTDFSRVRPYF